MMKVLIVANETAGGDHLRREVSRLIAQGEHSFTLLVPSSRPRGSLVWTEGEARAIANQRMEAAVKSMRDMGADIDGKVGDERPMDAIMDALRADRYDEIIVSTLPHGVSHWLHVDLPARVARVSGLPVHHIVGVGTEKPVPA